MAWQFPTPRERPALFTLVAVSIPTSVAVYWLTKKAVDSLLPYEYHYRPGTISGWFADLLHNYSIRRRKTRPVRVYMDGCFDMMHYGHANALRQARACGDELVVGLIPDSEIVRNKGPPVMNDDERYIMVESVKWVDEVLRGVPYDLTPEFVNELFAKHKIDYIIHGDDPCLLPDGTDAYAYPKELGRFRMIKRTEGVSTTDIVGRMLTCTRVNPLVGSSTQQQKLTRQFSKAHSKSSTEEELTEAKLASKFLPTSRRLVQFSNGRVVPAGGVIVYVDGAFDVLHPGHVELLKEARKQGDFLLVGLHTDEDVGRRRGPHLPIMNLHERSLSVLACKYVDEVVIGAPSVITEDLLKTFNINLVVRGSKSETSHLDGTKDRYGEPKAKGIFKQLSSPSEMTTSSIIRRIMDRRTEYEARQAKKMKSEENYHQNKGGIGFEMCRCESIYLHWRVQTGGSYLGKLESELQCVGSSGQRQSIGDGWQSGQTCGAAIRTDVGGSYHDRCGGQLPGQMWGAAIRTDVAGNYHDRCGGQLSGQMWGAAIKTDVGGSYQDRCGGQIRRQLKTVDISQHHCD